MSQPIVVIDKPSDGAENDVDMTSETGRDENGGEDETGLEQIETEVADTPKFIDYLKSPIVEISLGEGDEQTMLYAHQGLLAQSPYLADLINSAGDATPTRRIALTEDVSAMASALEWLYKKDYFPTLSGSSSLEHDPTIPTPDNTGIALLRHARIYTLAKTLGLPDLSALAHRKIHLAESTARGEIAYARYVYGNTKVEDVQIRKPVAQFWATRSHVLRHEAEDSFKETCLSYPQFALDVLTMVLDAQEKRSGKLEPSGSVGRKRARMSQG
ncbi:hypothetical protein K461DRAFT_279619 [Myriangium duriaei CBS 260.36]|uniref:BTB domain-containing protein n=1 Tax=Myriangium duriaei CBS 260.36 TaxID=1168546 RepID=A0A9P4IY93_9PEZI|nr:hypothetical protein K461DRAFT_279619 [Myriangium duriaei CBS 260.36]